MRNYLFYFAFIFVFATMNAQTVVWSDNFDDLDISDWTLYDEDGDGYEWGAILLTGGESPILTSLSWSGIPLTPDNWAVSPAIDLTSATGTITLKWFVFASDPLYNLENYGVYVGTSNTVADLMTGGELFNEEDLPATLTERTLDLSAFAGETVYIAFRHYDVSDQFRIGIDDVSVEVGGGGDPDPGSGNTCEDAKVVTTLPYDDAGNTSDYGDDYDNADVPPLADGAITNGTGSNYYITGDDVVYAYTPTEDEIINVSTTNDDDWIGLWAFTGCPFTSTVGYHTAINGATRLIEGLPVTAGETYYFVISTWAAPQSTDYTIHIEKQGENPEPGDGCEWTVIVEDTGYGDEVSWELRGADGTVLLSGGDYGLGYTDEQTVTADGPLEFYIEAMGTYNDNDPSYSVSNGTEVLVTGELFGGDDATYSDLICGEGEPGEGPCAEKTIMECGVTYTEELTPGAGEWTNYTGVTYNYPGSEKVFEFTAPTTGEYVFEVNQGTQDADFFLMDDCSNTATNLITNTLGYWTGTNPSETINLTEGVTYYLIADLYSSASSPTTISVTVTCPGDEPDPSDYCEPVLDCTDGDLITNVTFAGINNDTDCSPNGYGDYTDIVGNVDAGSTNDISVTVGGGWAYESVSVWIDYDNSSTFDENEFTYIGTGSAGAVTGNIIIPSDVADGSYRMRVRVAAVGETTATWDMACDEDQGYGETEDYTLIIGDDVPPVDDCEQTFAGDPNTGVGFINTGSEVYVAANDINVDANQQFTIETISLDVVSLGGEPTMFDLTFYADDNGGVGSQVGSTQEGLIPVVTPNGTFGTTGYPMYTVELTLAPEVLQATATESAKYWIGISGYPSVDGNNVYWVSYLYTDNDESEPTWQSPDGGFAWAEFANSNGEAVEGIMTVTGICETLGVTDMSSFDFAYYPNPVKDVLNVISKESVESVSVFNLAGQQLMKEVKVSNGQINVNGLTPGTYVFRVTLEGGQVETFKIIKK